jgi:acyl-coenzyme A synthetase/AMP-(fatty) acid ligase
MRENSVFALLASPNLGLAAKKAVSLFGASRSLPSVYTQIPYQFFLQDQSSYTDRNVFVEQHYISDDDRNVFILHSSGTTGLPKSICCSHRYLLGYSTCHDFPVESEAQGMNITTLPLYHVSDREVFSLYIVLKLESRDGVSFQYVCR